jgi:tRNA threonylcarbamoyladenosine biosynthesis protein TsaB
VPTLDVTAYPHRGQELPVLAVLQAGRRRVCWALYRKDGGVWAVVGEYEIGDPEEMAAAVSGELLLVGETTPAVTMALEASGVPYRMAPPGTHMRRAGYLAAMAAARMASGEVDDPATLSPLYLPRRL